MKYDFDKLENVEIIGVDISRFDDEQLSVLYRQAQYCEAMCKADIEALKGMVSQDSTFTHMSGKTQTRDEYFDDIKNKRLDYYTVGIENPVIEVCGDTATITYTSVLNASAYGAKGIYRIKGTHGFVKINEEWISLNR